MQAPPAVLPPMHCPHALQLAVVTVWLQGDKCGCTARTCCCLTGYVQEWLDVARRRGWRINLRWLAEVQTLCWLLALLLLGRFLWRLATSEGGLFGLDEEYYRELEAGAARDWQQQQQQHLAHRPDGAAWQREQQLLHQERLMYQQQHAGDVLQQQQQQATGDVSQQHAGDVLQQLIEQQQQLIEQQQQLLQDAVQPQFQQEVWPKHHAETADVAGGGGEL